jgi:hypothetical protein
MKLAQDVCLSALKLCVACNRKYTLSWNCVTRLYEKRLGRINVNKEIMCIFQCGVCGMLGLVMVKQCQFQPFTDDEHTALFKDPVSTAL